MCWWTPGLISCEGGRVGGWGGVRGGREEEREGGGRKRGREKGGRREEGGREEGRREGGRRRRVREKYMYKQAPLETFPYKIIHIVHIAYCSRNPTAVPIHSHCLYTSMCVQCTD